jgi:hypothetical protein
MNLRGIGWDGRFMDWINLDQNRSHWSAIVNTAMNLGSIKCWENLEWLSDWCLLKKDPAL